MGRSSTRVCAAGGDLSAFFGRVHLRRGRRRRARSRHDVVLAESLNEAAGGGDSRVDIAWLAETVTGHPASERERRLDLFGFHGARFRNAPGDDETSARRMLSDRSAR